MQTELSKPKRRFQFSMRTLLIGITLLAIPCAWLGRKIEQKRKKLEAVTVLRELGGTVYYDYDIGNVQPAGPDWLRKLLGGNFFNEAQAVFFDNDAIVTDERLASVKVLNGLTWLNLYQTSVTDAGLVNLKELTQLDYLNLGATAITDAGLIHLKGLTQLTFLGLEDTKVTNAGVKELQKALPNCDIR